MSGVAWAWLAIGLYVVLGFAIAFAARRHVGVGMSDFFLADRRMGGIISSRTVRPPTPHSCSSAWRD